MLPGKDLLALAVHFMKRFAREEKRAEMRWSSFSLDVSQIIHIGMKNARRVISRVPTPFRATNEKLA